MKKYNLQLIVEKETNSISKSVPIMSLIAIGASTGGPVAALEKVLNQTSSHLNFLRPIIIIQHMPRNYLPTAFANRLNTLCKCKCSHVK